MGLPITNGKDSTSMDTPVTENQLQLPVEVVILIGRLTVEVEMLRAENARLRGPSTQTTLKGE